MLSRRECLQMAVAAQSAVKASPKLGIPGPYRGKVVSVHNPSSIVSGKYQAEPVRQMMRRGMAELTGATWEEAWKQFFQPGDVVGIKVNPVGQPHVISAPEVLREIVAGLNAAGVKNKEIVVYDRYRDQFFNGGFDKWLPEGVRTSYAAREFDNVQLGIEGYDPDQFLDFPLTNPGLDVSDPRARRSHVALFMTKEVNKLINLPVLKDHQSAGVTLALKNLSHGLVNNVSRSHATGTANACGMFIPAVVSLPVIRNKTVLHILDGIKGCYHGGPSARPQFVWEHRTLYFATDPVALDHVGWKAIDAQRAAVGMAPVMSSKPDRYSTFTNRQPEHVELAGQMGLGEWDEKKIDVRRVNLG